VVPVPSETVAVAMFQWKRLPISRKVVMRYLAVALVIVIACAGLAYGLSKMGTKTYGARTTIYYPLNAALSSGSFLREDRALSSAMVDMESHAVLDPVAAQFHLTFDALSKKEVVTILQDSEVIQIEVDDRSASQAQSIVGAISSSYLKQVPNEDAATEAFLNKQIASDNSQLGTLTTSFNDLEAKRQSLASVTNPNPPESPAELSVQSQITFLNGEVTTLQGRLDAVTVDNLSQPHIQQQTPPYVLNGPVSPKPMRAGLAGALAGIMLAVIALTLLLRRRLKRAPNDQLD